MALTAQEKHRALRTMLLLLRADSAEDFSSLGMAPCAGLSTAELRHLEARTVSTSQGRAIRKGEKAIMERPKFKAPAAVYRDLDTGKMLTPSQLLKSKKKRMRLAEYQPTGNVFGKFVEYRLKDTGGHN